MRIHVVEGGESPWRLVRIWLHLFNKYNHRGIEDLAHQHCSPARADLPAGQIVF
jgi:hypothetical protein